MDEAGQVRTLAWPDNFAVTYNFDTMKRLQSIVQGATTLATYSYDDLSRRQTAVLGNGREVAYAYTPGSVLETLNHKNLIDTDANGTGDGDAMWSFQYHRTKQVKTKALPRVFHA
jgi:hypothetical protein